MRLRGWGIVLLAAVLVAGAGYYAWWRFARPELPEGFAQANGRIESEQVQIATKFAGRVAEVLAGEGRMVEAGAVVARMDAKDLQAQLQEGQAQVRRLERAREQAAAAIAQSIASRTLARRELVRAENLHRKGFLPTERLDQARAAMDVAEAGYNAAIAGLSQAEAATDAARANVLRIETALEDSVLVAPRRGRIQYKLVQSGEVVAAGAPVLTLLDLGDVYMTIFLPAREAGRLALGDEARIVLDPVPQYVIPATVSFVAADAQFTPKSVETKDEREKLMFRIKLTIAPELLTAYEPQVKTGVRGVGYVRTRKDAVWPGNLSVKLPDPPK